MEDRMRILLCEDDENLGMLLREYLQAKGYNVDLFVDGESGYKAFLKGKYDICVLDVMMPKKDGFTLAQEIRTVNSEVPIIFLTAKSLKDDIFEGFKIGADDYITKPFTMSHLDKRIGMLIHSRRVLKQKFTGTEPVNEEVAGMQSSDDKLLERVEAFVVRELANPDLSVELIASETGVSRSHLHRRLKALTATSPSTYIKQARMRHAAHLLTEKRMAVSEVAYATGFSSLSHFSTVFKEFYGMSPTRYVAINGDRRQ